MKRKPKPRNFLVRYTLQGAALTWGPFEADDGNEAESVASKILPHVVTAFEVEEVKS